MKERYLCRKKWLPVVALLVVLGGFGLWGMQSKISQAGKNYFTVDRMLAVKEGQSKTISFSGNVVVKGKDEGKLKKISFTSSDTQVAKVNSKGKVTGKSAGSCQIKVKVSYVSSQAVTGAGGSKQKKNKICQKTYKCQVVVSKNKVSIMKESLSSLPEDYLNQQSDFALGLLKEDGRGAIEKGENVLISPDSVMSAMLMAANGASGSTRTEMEKVLCGGNSREIWCNNQAVYNQALHSSPDVEFYLANSVWIRDDPGKIQVKPDFLSKNKELFAADAYLEPFDQSTVTQINNWVKKNTNKMIPSIIDRIPDEIGMYLINATTFEGRWSKTYEENQVLENEDFTDGSGKQHKVTMLSSSEGQYISSDCLTGVVKPYEGNEFAFMALLPNENVTVSTVLEQMTGEQWRKLYLNRSQETVITQIPEFSYDYKSSMETALQQMGIKEAFIPAANFQEMASTESGYLYIDQVLHKTHIELDRNGTKAAAVTAISMNMTGCVADEEPPKKVILNRPFIYGIIDTYTGYPVFIGVLNHIED